MHGHAHVTGLLHHTAQRNLSALSSTSPELWVKGCCLPMLISIMHTRTARSMLRSSGAQHAFFLVQPGDAQDVSMCMQRVFAT